MASTAPREPSGYRDGFHSPSGTFRLQGWLPQPLGNLQVTGMASIAPREPSGYRDGFHSPSGTFRLQGWLPQPLGNLQVTGVVSSISGTFGLQQRPVKQVRGPGHNVSCGAPALVLHENMRNTCLNYLQVRPR